jgi:hypothetical protein
MPPPASLIGVNSVSGSGNMYYTVLDATVGPVGIYGVEAMNVQLILFNQENGHRPHRTLVQLWQHVPQGSVLGFENFEEARKKFRARFADHGLVVHRF